MPTGGENAEKDDNLRGRIRRLRQETADKNAGELFLCLKFLVLPLSFL